MREAHEDVPFEQRHIERAIEHLQASLTAYDVPDNDAEAVIGAIMAHEEDLLAEPDEKVP